MENQQVIVEVPSVSAAPAVVPGNKVSTSNQKHKGRGSKQQSADKFRSRKNNETQNKIYSGLEEKYGFDLHRQITTATIDETPVVQRAREVKICLDGVSEISDATFRFLKYQQKVELLDSDKEVLHLVTQAQVRSKILKSRVSSGFVSHRELNVPYHERTMKCLTRAPYAIAVYLSNIGKTVHKGQKFYPKYIIDQHPLSTYAEDPLHLDTSLSDRGKDGVMVFNSVEERNRVHTILENQLGGMLPDYSAIQPFMPLGRLEFIERPGIRRFEDLIVKYNEMVQKINRKHSQIMRDVDFTEACGTVSQLVGHQLGVEDRVFAHCLLEIPDPALIVGACFKFGHDTEDPYHATNCSHITREVKPVAFMTSIQDGYITSKE